MSGTPLSLKIDGLTHIPVQVEPFEAPNSKGFRCIYPSWRLVIPATHPEIFTVTDKDIDFLSELAISWEGSRTLSWMQPKYILIQSMTLDLPVEDASGEWKYSIADKATKQYIANLFKVQSHALNPLQKEATALIQTKCVYTPKTPMQLVA